MAGLPHEIRERTDQLDTVGNTTAAVAKGFAVSSAALTALALFVAFKTNLEAGSAGHAGVTLDITLANPFVIVGVLIGAMMPFFFGAMTMGAVSRAANAMIIEVRRQFREIKGLLQGEAEPDTKACVSISTKAALREMMLPGILAVAIPVILGVLDVNILSGFLVGVLSSGFLDVGIYGQHRWRVGLMPRSTLRPARTVARVLEAHKLLLSAILSVIHSRIHRVLRSNILIKVVTVVSLVFVPFFLSLGGGLLHGMLF